MSKSYSVMFIDDSDTMLEIYEIMFKNIFKKIYLVSNRKQLDNILINYKVDVIFCDLKLKNKFLEFNERGDELMWYVREKYKITSLWVITGLEKEIVYKNFNLTGIAQGIIYKPFDKKDILKIFGN